MNNRPTLALTVTVFIAAVIMGFCAGMSIMYQWHGQKDKGRAAERVISVSSLSNYVELINSNDVDTLRQHINEWIDGEVIMLDLDLRQDWSSRFAIAASKVLARLHDQRKEHPFRNDDHTMRTRVDELLHVASERWNHHLSRQDQGSSGP